MRGAVMSRVAACAIVALSMLAGPARAADDPQALFEAANGHYVAGEYDLAARLYAEIIADHQLDDPVLYHNLGNAYFRVGQYGSAVFAYRRGLRLEPEPEVAAALDKNLDATRRVLQARYRAGGGSSEFIYTEPGGLLFEVTHFLSKTVITVGFIVLWVAFFGLLVVRRLRPALRGLGAAAVPVGLAAAIFAALLWGRVYSDGSFKLGVVITEGVTLHEGRHRDARGVDVPEGMEVRVLESDSDWVRVELANGRQGWVESTEVKQI